MESSATARYTPQNSRKRVFSGSSNEPDDVQIAPLSADQISKLKAKGKQKEVAFHEIINVDMDENVGSNKKMEGSIGISLGTSSASKYDSKTTANSAKNIESIRRESFRRFELSSVILPRDLLQDQITFLIFQMSMFLMMLIRLCNLILITWISLLGLKLFLGWKSYYK